MQSLGINTTRLGLGKRTASRSRSVPVSSVNVYWLFDSTQPPPGENFLAPYITSSDIVLYSLKWIRLMQTALNDVRKVKKCILITSEMTQDSGETELTERLLLLLLLLLLFLFEWGGQDHPRWMKMNPFFSFFKNELTRLSEPFYWTSVATVARLHRVEAFRIFRGVSPSRPRRPKAGEWSRYRVHLCSATVNYLAAVQPFQTAPTSCVWQKPPPAGAASFFLLFLR